MKKLFILFLALVASVGKIFASDTSVNGIWYDFDENSNTASVTYRGSSYSSYSNEYSGSVVIPSSVSYNNKTYSVTSIGQTAFCNCSSLTSIVLPNTITSIGGSAFYDCSGLTTIEIPNTVISLGNYVFFGCSSLPVIDNIRYADTYLIEVVDKRLSTYTIKEGTRWIQANAFENCTNLTSITIPNSVTGIGNWAFHSCTRLTSVAVESINPPAMLEDMWGVGYYLFNECSNLSAIYVPCGSLEAYQIAEGWSKYASKIKYRPYPSYTITKKAENGYINTTNTEGYTICDEPLVTCTANPNRGCYFVRWADGNTDNPRTIKLTQDTTMEAIFDYQLTGKCGKDSALTWTFDTTTFALNITGKGALSENYTYGYFIKSLTIGNEITSIGAGAFNDFKQIKNIILGSSVKILETGAFDDCVATETITCYSQRPPTVSEYALNKISYSTIVYVPADYLNTYQMHDAWGLYDVRPLGAKSTETTEINVNPAENTAEVVWPSVTGAASYELVIKDKDDNVICTLIFNANGQLTQIAFNAPSRDHAPQQTQASGFSFTVTGLEGGTGYDLTITAKDGNGSTLDTQTVSFTTTGEPQGVEEVPSMQGCTQKIIKDGQILILRGDKTYTLQGQEVR